MGFESRCSILNGQMIYIEKAKLKIADMWLIPLDRVTNVIIKAGKVKLVWKQHFILFNNSNLDI